MALVVDNDVNVGSGLTAGISTCTLGSGGGATTMNITKGSIVIALVGCNRTPAQGSFAKVISITGGGLTFVRRKQLQVHHLGGAGGERYSDTEIWWAYASSNQTNVALIATTDLVTDGTTFIAFGVTGFQGTYYQTHPWDDDVSVPAVKNCTIQDPPVSEVPSIIFNANGGILPSPTLSFEFMQYSATSGSTSGGFTQGRIQGNTAGSLSCAVEFAYKYNSRPSHLNPGFTNSIQAWQIIGDSLMENPLVVGGSSGPGINSTASAEKTWLYNKKLMKKYTDLQLKIYKR